MGREYITNLCRAKMKDNNEWCVGYYVKGLDMYEKEVHLIFEATTIFYSHGETDGFVEVVPTDALSKCEPFCLPMPLTEKYVKQCEME